MSASSQFTRLINIFSSNTNEKTGRLGSARLAYPAWPFSRVWNFLLFFLEKKHRQLPASLLLAFCDVVTQIIIKLQHFDSIKGSLFVVCCCSALVLTLVVGVARGLSIQITIKKTNTSVHCSDYIIRASEIYWARTEKTNFKDIILLSWTRLLQMKPKRSMIELFLLPKFIRADLKEETQCAAPKMTKKHFWLAKRDTRPTARPSPRSLECDGKSNYTWLITTSNHAGSWMDEWMVTRKTYQDC